MKVYIRIVLAVLIVSMLTPGLTKLSAQELKGFPLYREGCLAGDCMNGNSVAVRYWVSGKAGEDLFEVTLYYYSGDFKNGKLPRGKIYEQRINANPNKGYFDRDFIADLKPTTKIKSWADVSRQTPLYEGELQYNSIRDVRLQGNGKLTLADGFTQEGYFFNNYLQEGVMSGHHAITSMRGLFAKPITPRPSSPFVSDDFPPYRGNLVWPHMVQGIVKFTNGNMYTGTYFNSLKRGWGIYYNHEDQTIKEGVWNGNEQNTEVLSLDLFRTPNTDTTLQTFPYQIREDVFFGSGATGNLVYKGQAKNGKPHGKGYAVNADRETAGITFFYEGYFNNGQLHGMGSHFAADGSAVMLYQNNTLVYTQQTAFRDSVMYTGFVKEGKFEGRGELTISVTHKEGKLPGDIHKWTGSFIDSKFTGTGIKQGYRGQIALWEESGYYENGKLIEGDLQYTVEGLWSGAVINHNGSKAVVTGKSFAGTQTIVTLNNGEKLYGGTWLVFKDNAESFRKTCTACNGSGFGRPTQRVVGYSQPRTSSVHINETSIAAGYTLITTTASPIYETIRNTCDVCRGSGKMYDTSVKQITKNDQFTGSVKKPEEKKEKQTTAEEDYQSGLQAYKFGSYFMAKSWFESAAAKGHTEASFSIGNLYENGKINSQVNLEQARIWYKKAADSGHKEAKEALQRIGN